MNEPISPPATGSRPDLLIAMVSGDVIILAKLVRTLCPLQVLLFRTAFARQKGWTTVAEALLETLARDRPEILQSFRVIDLPDGDFPAKLEWFRRTLAEEVGRMGTAGQSTVAFDCTMGQSIFHVLGFDAIRTLGNHPGSISAVYLDADARRVVRATSRDAMIEYDQQPTKFRYQLGTELTERFGIYGVRVQEGRRLWPSTEERDQHEALCRLYDALCERQELRALFHSYASRLKRWKQRQIAARGQGDANIPDIPALVQRLIDDFAVAVKTQTNPVTAQTKQAAPLGTVRKQKPGAHPVLQTKQLDPSKIVHDDLARLIKTLVPGDNAVAWLDHYLADKRLAALNKGLNTWGQHLPRRLFPVNNEGPKRYALAKMLPVRIKTFMSELHHSLDLLATSAGHDPSGFTAEEYRAFLVEEVGAMDLPAPEKAFLMESGERLPILFESCVGSAAAREAGGRFGQSVAAVSQNLTLVREQRSIAELDTVILFANADLSVLEAKTHFGNADHKKIDANIKTLRDFGGAYSAYNLVYPLTAQDIAELLEGDPRALEHWKTLGMEDAAQWSGYLQSVRTTRDQRILGLDQLDRALRLE